MMRSYTISFLILISVVLFETAILSNIFILPAMPDLVLLCTLYFAYENGKTFGEVNAFFSGLLLDFLSGAPLGFNAFFRTLIAYLMGIFSHAFSFDTIFMPLLSAFLGTLSKFAFVFVLSILFPRLNVHYEIFSLPVLFELLMNVFLCPFVFRFLKIFPIKKYKEHSEN